MEPLFRAGGLASGIDSNSLIDQLIKLESRPIDLLRTQQSGMRTQISTLGNLISSLSSLTTAAQDLATGGALATKIEGEATGFVATSGSGATASQHSVQVNNLAAAAISRSAAFASATAPVNGGTLTLDVQGTEYEVTIADGTSLSDVAFAIRQSGAPVSATVISDGTSHYLSIMNNETGHPLTGTPADALTITENYTGSGGQNLTFATAQAAENAQVTVDGLVINRTSNSIGDIIPGVTLSLKAETAANETLVIGNDNTTTASNIQKFVDAYNSALGIIQSQLQASSTTNRATTLAGDAAVRSLQRSLQGLVTTTVGSASVRSLADIGVKSERDGTLKLDSTALQTAIGRDASAVNSLFADATEGLGEVTKAMAERYTNSTDGILHSRRGGIEDNIERIDDQIANMELRLDARRQTLIAQFTAMERVVAQLRSTGDFLNQQTLAAYGGG